MSRDQTVSDIGAIEDFPVNSLKVVSVGKRDIGVYRTRDDKVYAVLNFCPHRGAPLCEGAAGGTLVPSKPGEMIYGLEDEVVRCPWHGYEFSLKTGECLFTGLKMRAKTYPAEIRDGRVHVSGVKSGEKK